MKKILMISLLLLLTGCDITYNLEINDDFTEDIQIVEQVSGEEDDELNMRVQNGIPLYYMTSDDWVYQTNLSNGDNDLKLSLKGTFPSSNSNSNAVLQACKNYTIIKGKNSVRISASDFKIFDEYKDLDTITINLTCHNKVIENNADSRSGDIYTWNITKSNYKNKEIIMVYNLNVIDFDNPDFLTVQFGIIVFVLFVIGCILYFVLKRRFQSSNTI